MWLKVLFLWWFVTAARQPIIPQQDMPCRNATNCALQMLQANLRYASDPCDDFWSYACGNWQLANAHTEFMDNFDMAEDRYASQLRVVLESHSSYVARTDTPHLLTQLQTYYAACSQLSGQLEVESYLRAMPQELQTLLEHTAATAAEVPGLDWLSAIATLRKYGLNGVFVDETVGVASDDAQRYAVQLNMPDEDVYFSSAAEVRRYMRQFEMHETQSFAADDLIAKLYAFELELSALSREHRGVAPLERVMSLSALRQRTPQIDWQRYFSILLEQTTPPPPDMRLEVADITYLQAVGALLQRTDRRLSQLYLLLRLCKFLHVNRPQLTSDKRCIRHMGALLPLGGDFIYDRWIYSTRRTDERDLRAILAQLKTTFTDYLQAVLF